MRSKDLMQAQNIKVMEKLSDALKAEDAEEAAKAMTEFSEGIQELIIDEVDSLKETADRNVLAKRGVRQLTSEEKEFYEAWIEAAKSADPQQSIANIEKTMPETIIDSVIEEMKQHHELLNVIDFTNTKGIVKMITNAADLQLAAWGKITSAITEKLAGEIEVVDISMAKLSAYIPIPKDLLEHTLAPEWVDNYVRIILGESTFTAMEKGVIKGDGNLQPIGMIKDLKGAVVGGKYPDKDKKELNSLEPLVYCALIAPLAEKEKGGYRVISEVILIVNPVDYISKITPATTVKNLEGGYNSNIFPFPTKVIQSIVLDKNEAVLGLAKQYFLGVAKQGNIEYSDHTHFLEDERVYIQKLFANGKPKDNNAFVYLDITNLKPRNLKVEIVGDAKTLDSSTNNEDMSISDMFETLKDTHLTEEELLDMTKEQILTLAAFRGYEMTTTNANNKADIIADFLAQQAA